MSVTDMATPPINRAMRVLDRTFFARTVPTSAARVFNTKDISRCRAELLKTREMLDMDRVTPVKSDPNEDKAKAGGKCILLRPEILHNDPNTWSPKLQDLERNGTVGVIPFQLHLDYSHYTYSEILSSIIPFEEGTHDNLPVGFSQAGHVAHLNLRDKYLPYKHIIATVLADKNPTVTTVINKLNTVGSEDPFRTFPYEVLSGPDDMNVTLKEQGCEFSFDFAKVYWNSRLHTEHERLCDLFKEGEAVCDVMAGVGPFAIPAGKKRCFVYANDLNPESFKFLKVAMDTNKVGDFVTPFNEDGHTFIKTGTADLLKAKHEAHIYPKKKRGQPPPQPSKTFTQPRLFSHYVMNLPASAITFLPSFIGLYSNVPGIPSADIRKMFAPHTETPLPMVHVYCFSTKSDDNVLETKEICEEISRQIDFEVSPTKTPDMQVWDVRDVAPKKRMFCASFRLPEEVAFRET